MTVSLEKVEKEKKDVSFTVRVAPDFRPLVQRLAALLSADIGARLSQTQALEIAVRDKLAALEEKQKEKEVGL